MTVYEKNGWDNREDYLRGQAEYYDLSYQEVKTIADMLGESEDFDGLVSSLEDMSFENDFNNCGYADEFMSKLFG